MRCTHGLLILAAVVLFLPSVTWSQAKGRSRIAALIASEPDKYFDMLSGGKDTIIFAELDPDKQRMVQMLAAKFGITIGASMTRSEYRDVVNGASSAKNKSKSDNSSNVGGLANSPSGSTGGPQTIKAVSTGSSSSNSAGQRPQQSQSTRAEAIFRQLDKDQNGVLNITEIPEDLRYQSTTYDLNQDGQIDLNEFKAAVATGKSTMGKSAPTTEDVNAPTQVKAGTSGSAAASQAKLAAYRAAHRLPKGLPEWFMRLDQLGDCDGQIALWEARSDEAVLEQFAQIDLNGDGLLTPEEVLRWRSIQKKKTGRPIDLGVVMAANKPNS